MASWSKEEIELLLLDISIEELQQLLPSRSRGSILSKRSRVLKRQLDAWTKKEKLLLREMYQDKNTTERALTEAFPNRTIGAIRSQITRMKKRNFAI